MRVREAKQRTQARGPDAIEVTQNPLPVGKSFTKGYSKSMKALEEWGSGLSKEIPICLEKWGSIVRAVPQH